MANIPCITTVQGLGAAVQGIEALRAGDIGVRSLQDWAKRSAARDGRTACSSTRSLTRVDAETAHRVGFRGAAGSAGRCSAGCGRGAGSATPVQAMGLDLPRAARAWPRGSTRTPRASTRSPRSGSRFVEVGTVTGEPQPGNPRPRLFRLPADRAVVNRMGFNNDGAEVVARRLARAGSGTQAPRRRGRRQHRQDQGRSPRTTGRRLADYEKSTRLLAPYADYLVVNVSSPNTPGLRDLQSVERLRPLLDAVRRQADAVDRRGAPAAAGEDRPRPRPTRTCSPSPTWPSSSASTASSPPTPRSAATGLRLDARAGRGGRRRRAVRRAAEGPGRSRCCGCSASGSGPT